MATFKAEILIKGDKEVFFNSLSPEADESTSRARYSLKKVKGGLMLVVEAEDATAFRAIMTTLTGLMSVIESSIKVAKDSK